MQTVIAPSAPAKPATPARPADARDQRSSGFADLLEEARGEVDETPRPREKAKARPLDSAVPTNAPIAPEAEPTTPLADDKTDGKQTRGETVAEPGTAKSDRPKDADAAPPAVVSPVAAAPAAAPQVVPSPIVPTTPGGLNSDAAVIAPAMLDGEAPPPAVAAPSVTPAPVQAPISGTMPEPNQAPCTPAIDMPVAQVAGAGPAIAEAQPASVFGEPAPAAPPLAPVVTSPVAAPPAAAISGEIAPKAIDPKAFESRGAVPVDGASVIGDETRPTEDASPAPTPTTGLAATPASVSPSAPPAPAAAATPAPDAPAIAPNTVASKPAEAAAPLASSQPVQAETAKQVAKGEQPADASRTDKVEKDKAEKGDTARAEAPRGDQPRAEFRLPETAAPRAIEATARALDPAATQQIQVTSAPAAAGPQTLAADIAAKVGAQAAAPSVAVPVQQLAVTIAARANAGNTRFDIRLDPAELGRIDVTMTLDREGRAKARIVVEKQETYELLRQDQRNLEKALGQAGARVGEGSVEFQLRADTGDSGRGREGREPMDRQPGLAPQDDMPPPEAPAIALYARLAAARGGVDLRI